MENKPVAMLSDIMNKAIKVVTNPSAFYREMPRTGGLADPIVFAVVLGVVGGLANALISTIVMTFRFGFSMAMTNLISSVIAMPIGAFIGSFVLAGIIFVIWKLLGSNEPFETAYRCAAYSGAVWPILSVLPIGGLLPYVGVVIGMLWVTFLCVTASVETCKLDRNRSWIFFGVVFGLIGLLSLGNEFHTRQMMKDAHGSAGQAWREHWRNTGRSYRDGP